MWRAYFLTWRGIFFSFTRRAALYHTQSPTIEPALFFNRAPPFLIEPSHFFNRASTTPPLPTTKKRTPKRPIYYSIVIHLLFNCKFLMNFNRGYPFPSFKNTPRRASSTYRLSDHCCTSPAHCRRAYSNRSEF